MEITIKRIAIRSGYTIGHLSVNNQYFCDTLEDRDRGLTSAMSRLDIAKIKVKSQTAIPTGRYRVIFTYSPKFRRKMPLLLDVPGFDAIRFHYGNTAADSEGCILVGENKRKGMVLNSRKTFERLNDIMAKADTRGEALWVTIK